MGTGIIAGIVSVLIGGAVATVAAVGIVTTQTNAGTSIDETSSSSSTAAYNGQ
ncbi:MAG: hypothetical protein ABW004_15430 [Aeromicrobium sp.]